MIKHVNINSFEGNGIIERIEGNGWDIDANHIELNGINAQIIDDPENRIISLDGPAVEDLFKSLRDLLKENGELRALLDRDTTRKKYQSNLEKEKNVSRKLNDECDKLTEKIEELERKHKKAKEYIKELEKILKDTSQELADCRRNSLVLIEQKRELEDNNKQVAKSRDYWHDEWIKLQNDKNTLITTNENISAEIKRLREEISDLNAINKKLNEKNKELDVADTACISGKLVKLIAELTTLSSDEASYSLQDLVLIGSPHIKNILKNRKRERDEWRDRYLSLKRALNKTYGICYDDLREMYPCTYSDTAKEILRWIDGEMKNNTDYATKIFNKESKENIFSITFCRVPVEPEGVANEQG